METEAQRRTRLEANIQDFKLRGIIRGDGTLDQELYQAWFVRYVGEKEAKSIADRLEVVDDANFIAKEACADMHVSASQIPQDGNMNTGKLTQLVLNSVSPEKAKEELTAIIAKMMEDKKDDASGEENKTDTSGEGNNEEKPEDEKLVKACLLLKPIVDALKIRNQTDVMNADENTKSAEEEYVALLMKYGYDRKQIAKAMDFVASSGTDFQKEKEKAKEVPYNAYNDWRYIYYMSTLGSGFGVYYSKTDSVLRVVANAVRTLITDNRTPEEKGEEKMRQAFLMAASKVTSEKKKFNEDGFFLNLITMRDKYDIELDSTQMKNDFLGATSIKEYKAVYQKYLTVFYNTGRQKITDFTQFLKDYNDLTLYLANVKGLGKSANYGGMKGEELLVFCLDMRQKDMDITHQLETSLVQEFGALDKANGQALTQFIEQKFDAARNAALSDEANHNLMRDAMACYLLLQKTHENRSAGYKFRHPIDYRREKNAVERMNQLMNQHMKQNADEEEAEEFREMERRGTVFQAGFHHEKDMLRTFSIAVDQEREHDLQEHIQELDPIIIDEDERDNEMLLGNNDGPVIDNQENLENPARDFVVITNEEENPGK